jgi:hypothetical protein
MPTLSYSARPHSRRSSPYTPWYSPGQSKSVASGAPAAASSSAAENARAEAPEAIATCQGCALHQEAVRCATARICSIVSCGTGSDLKPRQLKRLSIRRRNACASPGEGWGRGMWGMG